MAQKVDDDDLYDAWGNKKNLANILELVARLCIAEYPAADLGD